MGKDICNELELNQKPKPRGLQVNKINNLVRSMKKIGTKKEGGNKRIKARINIFRSYPVIETKS